MEVGSLDASSVLVILPAASCHGEGQGVGNSGLAKKLKQKGRSVTPGKGQSCTLDQSPGKSQSEGEEGRGAGGGGTVSKKVTTRAVLEK